MSVFFYVNFKYFISTSGCKDTKLSGIYLFFYKKMHTFAIRIVKKPIFE